MRNYFEDIFSRETKGERTMLSIRIPTGAKKQTEQIN
jgi:hypothetical protein